MVAGPAEQVLSRGFADVERVASMSRPGVAVVTVQVRGGYRAYPKRSSASDTVHSNADWLPARLASWRR